MLYHAYQAQSDLLWPLRAWVRATAPLLDQPPLRRLARRAAAACAVVDLAEVTHQRPDWGMDTVEMDGNPVPVSEQEVLRTPFATLRRFVKEGAPEQPKVLVVAPMSGHFATLLRDTVHTVLQHHDVHVTDWHNVRDVPLAAGRFGLDEYTAHLIDFLAAMGPRSHVVAVCQPCVSALAAVALMAEDGHPATPASLTLMAGPIDCRVSPTEVNRLAATRSIDWFERHLISLVPVQHAGAGRRVYPGFVQLGAFMNMNRQRHLDAFRSYYEQLAAGDTEKAAATRAFYEEYFAVADLSAEFYLETVHRVFQDHALARGALSFRDRRVDPAAIRRTALFTVEGERDDICAVGQTLAAQELTPSLRPYMRRHCVQPNVGHYGVFSGKRWRQQIYPQLRELIHLAH